MTCPSIQLFMCTNITNPFSQPSIDWWKDLPLCTICSCLNTHFDFKLNDLEKGAIALNYCVVFLWLVFSLIVYVLPLLWLLLQWMDQKIILNLNLNLNSNKKKINLSHQDLLLDFIQQKSRLGNIKKWIYKYSDFKL